MKSRCIFASTNNTKTNNMNATIKIYDADIKSVAYGIKRITVELEYKGKYEKFDALSNNLEAIEAAKEVGQTDWDQRNADLFEIIEDKIDSAIESWVEECDLMENTSDTQNEY